MVPQQIFLMGQNHFLFRRVFTYGSPPPVQFRNYLEVFLFGTHFNETHLKIVKILESSSTPQKILQCTAIWECILVLKLHRRSLFWFLTVSNNHCSETLGICCVIFPVWWAMNGSKPFCAWNKLNSTVSFIKHRMDGCTILKPHTDIFFQALKINTSKTLGIGCCRFEMP